MDNPFDFQPMKLPDFRRRVGEWEQLVGKNGVGYVTAVADYLHLGHGLHPATPEHAVLGLESVEVSFAGMELLVIYNMTGGRKEYLQFDIDFGGFGP